MKKQFTILKIALTLVLVSSLNILKAQDVHTDNGFEVKTISDKQVLLEKIKIEKGTIISSLSTEVYVSYLSGDPKKFWKNVVIATAGIAVSTQLNKGEISEGNKPNNVSSIAPLGISVATLPSIWKNRPRGNPEARLWIQHRNNKGELLNTWNQPISKEAKNSAELLTISIDKQLNEGTLEIYLQNNSKRKISYWGTHTAKNAEKKIDLLKKKQNEVTLPVVLSVTTSGCSIDVYINSNTGVSNTSMIGAAQDSELDVAGLLSSGYTLNYSIPFDCETGGTSEGTPEYPEGTDAYDIYIDFLQNAISQNNNLYSGGGGGGSTNGTNQDPNYNPNATIEQDDDPGRELRIRLCQTKATQDYAIDVNACMQTLRSDWNNTILTTAGLLSAGGVASVTLAAGCTMVLPIIGTVACGAVGAAITTIITGLGFAGSAYNIGHKFDACANSAQIKYAQAIMLCN